MDFEPGLEFEGRVPLEPPIVAKGWLYQAFGMVHRTTLCDRGAPPRWVFFCCGLLWKCCKILPQSAASRVQTEDACCTVLSMRL